MNQSNFTAFNNIQHLMGIIIFITKMIIQRTHNATSNKQIFLMQRTESLPFYVSKQTERRNIPSLDRELEKRKSCSILDAKKIKTKIEELFKSDEIRKSQTAMYSTSLDNKRFYKKKIKDSIKIGLQKKRYRDMYLKRATHNQKMEIVSSTPKELCSVPVPAFKVQQIKTRKKINHFEGFQEELLPHQQSQVNTYNVLSVGRKKVKHNYFIRKPSLPLRDIQTQDISNDKNTNNFLRTRKYLGSKKNKQIGFYDELQPWSKVEDEHNFPDFP